MSAQLRLQVVRTAVPSTSISRRWDTSEVSERRLTACDYILMLCSPAVWEFMAPQQAAEIVGKYPAARASEAAEQLANASYELWKHGAYSGGIHIGDTTVGLVYLNDVAFKSLPDQITPSGLMGA